MEMLDVSILFWNADIKLVAYLFNQDNFTYIIHCVSRLRFGLKDEGLATSFAAAFAAVLLLGFKEDSSDSKMENPLNKYLKG